MNRTTTITLGEELNAYVERLIERGRYATTSEVVRDALRTLEAEDARTARIWAYAESLPLSEPDEWDREILKRVEEARARGEYDEPGLTSEEVLAQLKAEGLA
jgi:antitoxin ParD1/3/4